MKPAAFDRASLLHVAELASLTLEESETERLAQDMSRILAYVAELEQVDTSNVEPTTLITVGEAAADAQSSSALRQDTLEPSLPKAAVLAQAPRATENGFLVPTFVES